MPPLLRRLFPSVLLAIAAVGFTTAASAQNTMVRLQTTMGPVDMSLLAAEAPLTVANFLAYVRGGDYTDVFFHRNALLQPSPQCRSSSNQADSGGRRLALSSR